jgi:hypothetical protein
MKLMARQKAPNQASNTGSNVRKGKRRRRKGMCLEDRPILEQSAAGIDIGSREIFAAVPPDRDPNPVRVFPTFTEDLQELATWLLRCGVTTVAMESTGVYWIPLYDILEQREFPAGVRKSETVALRHPVMPVGNGFGS